MLQRFFGMMRDACGSNDHPDSQLFIQMYRLISTFSLVQPPKGSNVNSSDIFNTLLQINDIADKNEKKEQWEAQIDTILDSGCRSDVLIEASDFLKEHDYVESETSSYACAYIAGYVARKATKRFVKFVENKKPFICMECKSILVLPKNDDTPETHKLIEIRSNGFLLHPSVKLQKLIELLEIAVMTVVGDSNVESDLLFKVTEVVEQLSPLLIGCDNHSKQLTRRIITFYITTRMYFISKQWNKNNNQRSKTKEERKLSKLTTQDIDKIPEIKSKLKRQRKRKSGDAALTNIGTEANIKRSKVAIKIK